MEDFAYVAVVLEEAEGRLREEARRGEEEESEGGFAGWVHRGSDGSGSRVTGDAGDGEADVENVIINGGWGGCFLDRLIKLRVSAECMDERSKGLHGGIDE